MDVQPGIDYAVIANKLQPLQAIQVFQERIRKIGKGNQEIVEWLQERRRVEEQYVAGLEKLATIKVPDAKDLGIFQPAWDSMTRSVRNIASSHRTFNSSVRTNAEDKLRNFHNAPDMADLVSTATSLQVFAKELDEAQDKLEKLMKKGGKASAAKVDAATQRLEGATQDWYTRAPSMFRRLQTVDAGRALLMNEILTALGTDESDQASRTQRAAEGAVNAVLQVSPQDETVVFYETTMRDFPDGGLGGVGERRSNTRQSSIAGSTSAVASHPSHPSQPPATPTQPQPSAAAPAATTPLSAAPEADAPPSERSSGSRQEPPSSSQPPQHHEKHHEKNLRSRIGTMLGRRRQSVHAGFGPLSPPKNSGGTFSRIGAAAHSHSHPSSNNLNDGAGRLSSLAETDAAHPPATASSVATNGVGRASGVSGVGVADASTLHQMSVDDIFGVPPPPGPPPSHQTQPTASASASTPSKDAEGFSIPAPADDPISRAQREAAAASGGADDGTAADGDTEQAIKLSIQNEPVADEDPQAKQAALSSVANTLSLGMPTRKTGTVRGRRDVRNTIYVPTAPSVPEATAAPTSATSPTLSPSLPFAPSGSSALSAPSAPSAPSRSSTFGSVATPTRPAAVAALASEGSLAGTSDSQSVRSGTSLSSLAQLKHSDAAAPGLNASIIERVSASFEGGVLKAARMAGEVAFSYDAPSDGTSDTSEKIRINNFALLEAIGPNRIFVQNTVAADEFALNTSHLQHKATVGFTFRAHADNTTALAAHCPVVLRPEWKPLGDKLGLVLHYSLNPESRLAAASDDGQPPPPVVLRNFLVYATYEGGHASGAQTKPTGTHLKDRHLVFWKLPEVTLREGVLGKFVARLIGDQGTALKPGHVEARWEYSVPAGTAAATWDGTGISISHRVAAPEEDEDPFADTTPASPPATNGGAAAWADVPHVRQIVSGTYEAK